jgi:hypothetical protein
MLRMARQSRIDHADELRMALLRGGAPLRLG